MLKKKIFFIIGISLFISGGVHPLTLDESIQIALENNAEVLIKREEIKEAAAGIKEARSGLFPQLNANADYHNYLDCSYPAYKENSQINILLTQTLYAGGRLINTLRQSKLNLKAVKEKQRRTRREIIFEVKNAFYGALLAEKFVRINQETLSLAREQLRIAKERYRSGEVSNYDVLRAEVEIARLKPELVRAENRLQTAQNQFRFILGLDLETAVKLEGELVYLPEEVNPKDNLAAAFVMRSELREMEARKEMSELDVRIAKGGSKPTVSLIAGNYWDEKSVSSAGDEWNDYRMGIISVDIPLFDGLLARAKTRKALARLNAARISQKNLRQRVKLEVENASLNLEAARETAASQTKNVEKAERCLKIMQARYKEGKAAQLDIIDAQTALSEARVGYARSIYDYTLADARLNLAVGRE